MKIHPLKAGNFKHDEGARPGVVPKTRWSRTNPANGNRRIDKAVLGLLHDAPHKVIAVKCTEKGVRVDEIFTFNELFNA